MNLRSISASLAGAVVLFLAGCSSDSTEDRPGGSVGSDSGADSQLDAENGDDASDVPDAAPACLDVQGTVFAVDTLYLGDMDWDGNLDPEAWMIFGSDLDGVHSTAASTDLCQPAAGAAPADVYPDGNDGIDNAFGKSVLPLLATVSPDFSNRVNGSITNGSFTWLLKIDPFGQNESSVTTMVYTADSRTTPPKFDGKDCWPVAPTSLVDTSDFESAKVSFPGGKIFASTLTTGEPGDLELAVPLSGTVLRLTARNAKIVVDFGSDLNEPSRGMISGILVTDEFIEEARNVLGFLDSAMCSGPAFDAVAASIRRASDIMKDGSQDPTATCDGISIGIGFTLGKAGFSGLGSAVPVDNPCP